MQEDEEEERNKLDVCVDWSLITDTWW
jgi:hypothetical protein